MPRGRWLSIDPGMHIGISIWDSQRCVLTTQVHATALGTWEQKFSELIMDFRGFLATQPKLELLAIERPAFFQSSGGSMVAARGDLTKLTLIAGAISGLAIGKFCQVHWIDVFAWKGQLSKEIIARRITALGYDIRGKTNHEVDAIGIGLYELGVLRDGMVVKKEPVSSGNLPGQKAK